MKYLITGGAGFVGHHIIESILLNSEDTIVSLDRLSTSGNLNRLTSMDCWEAQKHRVKLVHHDLRSPISAQTAAIMGSDFDVVLHLAASSHVDRSIVDPMSFVLDNVVGTASILDYIRHNGCGIFLYFSTDEVFGPAPMGVEGGFAEWDRYNSGNPYSATKAGAEELCLAYANTYGLNITVTHCMNIMGERQHPEKFIPMTIRKILKGERVQIHANENLTASGARTYIHARNVADAVNHIIKEKKPFKRSKFNIVGEKEVSNLELALMIARHMNAVLDYELVSFHASRPGHDLRYALDGRLLRGLGWKPPMSFGESLNRTIDWTLEHKEWLMM